MRLILLSAALALAAPAAIPARAAPAATQLPVTPSAAEAASPAYLAKTAKNRAAFTEFVKLYYQERKIREPFERFVARDYIQHNPRAGDGREAAIAFLEKLMGHSTARMDVRRILVDGDYAVVQLIGRQNPQDRGHAIMNIFRMEDGIIMEHWDVTEKIPETTVSGRPMG